MFNRLPIQKMGMREIVVDSIDTRRCPVETAMPVASGIRMLLAVAVVTVGVGWPIGLLIAPIDSCSETGRCGLAVAILAFIAWLPGVAFTFALFQLLWPWPF